MIRMSYVIVIIFLKQLHNQFEHIFKLLCNWWTFLQYHEPWKDIGLAEEVQIYPGLYDKVCTDYDRQDIQKSAGILLLLSLK